MRTIIYFFVFVGGLFIISVPVSSVASTLPHNAEPTENLSNMKLSLLSKLSPKEYKVLTGKRLSFTQQASLILLKSKMNRAIKKNPDITVGEFSDSIKTKDKIGLIILGVILLGLLLFFLIIKQLPD